VSGTLMESLCADVARGTREMAEPADILNQVATYYLIVPRPLLIASMMSLLVVTAAPVYR